MVKRTKLEEFKVQRYSKSINMMNLKNDDRVVSVDYSKYNDVLVVTHNGYGLWYDVSEISIVGIKASGVKSIKLKDDYVVGGILFNPGCEYLSIIMDRGTAKRLRLSELEKGSRANRGLVLMKEIKSNPSKIVDVYIKSVKETIMVVTDKEKKEVKLSELSIMDRYSNGSYIVKDRINYTYLISNIIDKDTMNNDMVVDTIVVKKKEDKVESLKEIDDRMMTINDLLNSVERR